MDLRSMDPTSKSTTGLDQDDHGPVFPPELERRILVEAFLLDRDMEFTLNFLFVAHRFHEWVIPLVYEVVLLHEDLLWPPVNLIMEKLPRYGKHVRHLLIQERSDITGSTITDIITQCPNLTDLALVSFAKEFNDDFTEALSLLPLTELAVNITLFPNITPSLSKLFGRITHLDTAYFSRWGPNSLNAISHFTNLTHIVVLSNDGLWKDMYEVTNRVPGLKVIVRIRYRHGDEIGEMDSAGVDLDPREVNLECNFLLHWRSAAQGFDSPWLVAESALARRRLEKGFDS